MNNWLGNKMFFIEEIQPNYSNLDYTKKEYHDNNSADINLNIRIGVGNKEL